MEKNKEWSGKLQNKNNQDNYGWTVLWLEMAFESEI